MPQAHAETDTVAAQVRRHDCLTGLVHTYCIETQHFRHMSAKQAR